MIRRIGERNIRVTQENANEAIIRSKFITLQKDSLGRGKVVKD